MVICLTHSKNDPYRAHPDDFYVSLWLCQQPVRVLSDGVQRDAVLYRFRSVLLYPVCADDGGDGLGVPERRGRHLFVDEQQRRPRYAFIGTFMWFSSYVVWMVSTAAKVWVPFSTFLFGADKTQVWSLAGLSSTQVVGILAVCWMVMVTRWPRKASTKLPVSLPLAVFP